jgi:geranylgeranyl diphosphate synthase type I
MLEELRHAVDEILLDFFAERARRWPRAEDRPLFEAAESLTRRGGKRLRAALVHAGHVAAGGDAPIRAIAQVGAAFELLQTYLLVQDDWMDGDLVRRGGPAVHAQLRTLHADEHLADAVAILASDLAAGQAWWLLSRAPFPAERLLFALEGFAEMHEEVVVGQHLDLLGDADVERVHTLKTAGYTVAWPLRVGARLAGARAEVEASLATLGARLGRTFQVRDDVLGTFGEPADTGKPVANDLRHGKETAVIAEARARNLLIEDVVLAAFGVPDADDDAARRARDFLAQRGVEEALEARIAGELEGILAEIEVAPLTAAGRTMLAALATRLTQRRA